MAPGTVIEASTPRGKIRIHAGENFKRTYTAEGMEKTFRLNPRHKRWYGSLGLLRPTGDGSVHAVLGEEQQNFGTTEEFAAWLARQKLWHRPRWTSDGLMVDWDIKTRPEDGYQAWIVNVRQIYIAGRKPVRLPGASDEDVRFTGARSAATPHHHLPPARKIRGRKFTSRALDLMSHHGITEEMVLKTIASAPGETKGKFRYYAGRDAVPAIDCYVCVNAAGTVLFAVP